MVQAEETTCTNPAGTGELAMSWSRMSLRDPRSSQETLGAGDGDIKGRGAGGGGSHGDTQSSVGLRCPYA